MGFHSRHSSDQQQTTGAAAGIFQAAQALGSIGAPTGNLQTAVTGTAAAGREPDTPYPPTASSRADSTQHPPADRAGSAYAVAQPSHPSAAAADMSHLPQFETPRRTQGQRRTSDELHMASAGGGGISSGGGVGARGALSPRDYAGGPPRINLEHAPPESSSQFPAASASQLPGALQAGRPVMNLNTAVPTVPSQQPSALPSQDPYATPVRPPPLATAHSYSRSSPGAAFDGPYSTFSPTAGSSDPSGFMSSAKYTPSGTRNVSNTPLGLADIRPRADSNLTDGLSSGASMHDASSVPATSNYTAPWATYALDWCKWPTQGHDAGKVALGSYLEDGHNFIQILQSQLTPSSSDAYTPGGPKYNIEYRKIAEATHSYPVTRLLWEPLSSQKQSTDLLATSGDHLRLWSLPAEVAVPTSNNITRSSNHGRDHVATKLTPLALLSNSKTPEHTAPLTSLDWNAVSPSRIITSSIDTTCTIWDIPTLTAKTQLIAHDKEVYDVRFCANSDDVFVSCGADGSVRMFDLRSLEHSTIIYEPTSKDDKDAAAGRISPTLAQQTMSYAPPLLRLAASPHDAHLLATFASDSNLIRILDVRQPGQALLELRGHAAALNCIEWCPARRGTLASGADDALVLVWDLLNQNHSMPPTPANGAQPPENGRGPTASWQCEYEVSNISWAPHNSASGDGDWIGVSAGRGVWGVKL